MEDHYPIIEFDEDRTSITMPDPFKIGVGTNIPARGVLCFFMDVLNRLNEEGKLSILGYLGSEMGKHPVYSYSDGAAPVTVFHPGVGAPLAAAFLEELIAVGVTKYIVCGGCGVLDRKIDPGYPVILTAAVRDEGTSYHYIPPSREVKPHPRGAEVLEEACREAGVEYRLGKTWTTDAFYRETPGRRRARLAEGCDVVEMEAAAFFAVAQFREIKLGQIVYGGDLVHPDGWDLRSWHGRGDARRQLFDLAVKAVRLL
ncbi:MAG TPA: nucleoside phosphorylase [Anaerolineaceae bacterium]|nr:nucleoside phosphorylase [Anaerolineaceae bacterium]